MEILAIVDSKHSRASACIDFDTIGMADVPLVQIEIEVAEG